MNLKVEVKGCFWRVGVFSWILYQKSLDFSVMTRFFAIILKSLESFIIFVQLFGLSQLQRIEFSFQREIGTWRKQIHWNVARVFWSALPNLYIKVVFCYLFQHSTEAGGPMLIHNSHRGVTRGPKEWALTFNIWYKYAGLSYLMSPKRII